MKKIKKLKNFTRDTLRLLLGKKGYVYLRFIITHGYIPNINNPKTWNEKIQSRKLNDDPGEYALYVDKLQVRKFVEDKIGREYLIPLLFSTKKINYMDFDKLPNSFVIKTSNGGGGENVKIIRNKQNVDIKALANEFNSYLNIKIGDKIDENYYDFYDPQILVEELLLDSNGNVPSDFKLHIFTNSNKLVIQVDKDRFENHKRSLFNESLEPINESIQPKYDPLSRDFVFPDNMKELIEKAKLLAEGFEYIRVDMYSCNGVVYFGEMTFCHGSGWEKTAPKAFDMTLGSYWR